MHLIKTTKLPEGSEPDIVSSNIYTSNSKIYIKRPTWIQGEKVGIMDLQPEANTKLSSLTSLKMEQEMAVERATLYE